MLLLALELHYDTGEVALLFYTRSIVPSYSTIHTG
jgi:hypothetical protein